MKHRKYHKSVSKWPKFDIAGDDVDGNIPSTCVRNWQHFHEILKDPFFNHKECELIYRGQRRFDWGLTPSIGRYNEAGTFTDEVAKKQIDNFKLSIRGRVVDSSIQDDDDELWGLGQHHGLKTNLLDWSYSPYVAMFFCFEEPDQAHDRPKNYSRAIFVINKSEIEKLLSDLFVQPMKNDHSRLISQAGLFTRSPAGEQTLVTYLINELADHLIDVDEPNELAKFICKIHVPIEREEERLECFKTLRKMNLHHASLFPDLIGSSNHCNELLGDYMVRHSGRRP